MASSASKDYDPATSPVLYSILRIVGDSNGLFDNIQRASKRKKGSLSVLLGVLADNGLISITELTPLGDRRKKKYSINLDGLRKYFLEWANKRQPQSTELKKKLKENRTFIDHFNLFFSKNFLFEKLDEQFAAFIYIHSIIVAEFLFRLKENPSSKTTLQMASKAEEINLYLLSVLTHLTAENLSLWKKSFSDLAIDARSLHEGQV